jgi:hypothetical protein
MAAKLKYKRMLITRMQTKFRLLATFHNLINSHWSLPLNILVETRKKQVHNVSKTVCSQRHFGGMWFGIGKN